jgi:glycosyltransferase involved in cell wall biosynthesis
MRLTHVITRLIVGGAQENTISSVLGLRKKPATEVFLVSGPTSGPEGSLEQAVSSIPSLLTVVPELIRPVHPWKDFLAWRKLTRLFQDQRPDIVHTHSGKAGILGRLAAHHAKVAVIVHTIHGPSFGVFQNPAANAIFLAAERIAGRVTSHFVSVSDAMTQQYMDAGIGCAGQYSRIFSGFNLEPYLLARNDPALRAHYGLAPGDFVIGKIARLFRLKGHDELFEAAPAIVRGFPASKFLLVGDGEWRGRFEARARALGLQKHFVFTGLVSPAEVPRLIGIMDAVVHLSRREGLPRALPQALAAGKPVIACDCDGAKEVCIEDHTGFLVTPGDLHQFVNRVLLLARDSGLRKRLAQNGQALVITQFPEDKMVDDLHVLYLRLLAERMHNGSRAI